jgi:hypothetical protein
LEIILQDAQVAAQEELLLTQLHLLIPALLLDQLGLLKELVKRLPLNQTQANIFPDATTVGMEVLIPIQHLFMLILQ